MSRARRLLLANGFDAVGRGGFDLVTDVIAVTALGASAAQMGLLNAAGMVAFLVLAAPVGVWVDRLSSGVTLGGSALLKAVVAAALAAGALTGVLSFWVPFAGVLVFGVLSLVSETGQVASVPRVAEPASVPRVAALLQGTDSVVGIVVPSVVGLALAFIHGGVVLLVAAGILVVAALAGFTLAARAKAGGPEAPDSVGSQKRSFLAELRAGAEPFRDNRALRRLTASTAVLNAALAIVSAVEMVLLLRFLGLSVSVVGISATIGAVGGALGASVSATVQRRIGMGRLILASSVVLCLSAALLLALFLPLPLVAITAILFVQSFLWGMAQVAKNVAVYAWFSAEIPGEVLGRASGLQRSVTFGIIPVASLVGGALGELGLLVPISLGFVLVVASTVLARRAFGPQAVA